MTEKPLVSVIINCYNSEKYLRETIDSLLSQTYEDWEAIFWDNCSTDKTSEIIANYNDSRFRYFLAEKNTPLGEARNLAMEKVRGEYLCFLDSDDIWDNSFLKIGITCLVGDRKLVGFYSNFDSLIDNKIRKRTAVISSGSQTLSFVFKNYRIGMSACIVRSSVVKEHIITFDNNYQLIEDLDFFISILRYGSFFYDSRSLMTYRYYPENSSNSKYGLWAIEFSDYYKKILDTYVRIENPYLKKKDLDWIRNRIVYFRLEYDMKIGDKWDIVKCLISNPTVNLRYWLRLIYVLGGANVYNKLKALN